MTHNRIKITLGTIALLCATTACWQPGGAGSPFGMNRDAPEKRLRSNSAPVETVCYIDTEKQNPLNAGAYYFSESAESAETCFFNYVVLAYAYLSKDSRGYAHLELSPSLKYILQNGLTYIEPLRQKGIQVLVEVRSGNFSDTDEGAGLGLGTMDMAAIEEFTKELKLLVDRYGIDGFDFNDIGGGTKAYPPFTRELKRFQSGDPLYPESLFNNAEGSPLDDPGAIEAILWAEGGSNFSNLIQRANEKLKETYSMTLKNGSVETVEYQRVIRSILVRHTNHGGHLLSQLRMAYMPDAYSGADPKVPGNLKYIVHDVAYNDTKPHASFWDETQNKDSGDEFDSQYIPLTIDLSGKKDRAEAEEWARKFMFKNPAGPQDDPDNQNRYGALYFINLPPVSESNSAEYLTYFSWVLFGRKTRLQNQSGAGNQQKTW